MAEDLFRIVYKSTAAHPAEVMLGKGHVAAILDTARRRNARAGITGVLVYTGIGFLQVLEGPRREVQEVFESILVDRRHHTLSVIEMSFAEARQFPGWAMSCLGASPDLDRALNSAGQSAGLAGEPASLVELLRRTLMILVDSPISLPLTPSRAGL
ncbi:BLUF domain-containing protein [Methylobacterium isbiliense]|uniref:BLUF domain-containing protein n=1 Tax=Methylobacterium isbiliense TaxID=315478 RepID=A0ABQ4SKQ6_9HYPH|nr:BLUF domain-containing protein [Methylobacterium isbiliense]MDN3626983.1 BLUF domain-containing protein [Methylobacterium isbiliense]GJE02896.1 hypothetical protein GMJLKIPL_4845 [Methylobacterium isbiliense]